MKTYYSKPKNSKLSINRVVFRKLIPEIVKLANLTISESMSLIIHFVSKRQMCKINSDYMKHYGITDVISFSYLTKDDTTSNEATFAELFICIKKAEIEAKERELNFADELTLYIVHGILHVAGYDDLNSKAIKKMRHAENRCMNYIKKHFDLSSIFYLTVDSEFNNCKSA